jgi:hypothetical protein
MSRQRIWNPFNLPETHLMSLLDQQIQRMEDSHPNLLPNIRLGETIVVASDYSGQHGSYHIISLVLADVGQLHTWEMVRQSVRRRYIIDGRRMAFKDLNDGVKLNALVPFLAAADQIVGLSITIAIDGRIKDLTDAIGREQYLHWKPRVWEKMLRTVNLVSFLVAGLSRQGQHLLWITDNDDIAANEARLSELSYIFQRVSSYYLKHKMGGFQCVKTSIDDGDRQFEDLASVPDLIAGALNEVLTRQKNLEHMPTPSVLTLLPHMSLKSETIMKWFSDHDQPLKRLVCVISPGKGLNDKYIWWPRFEGVKLY